MSGTRGAIAGVVAVAVCAAALAAVIGWPVLAAPSTRVFGFESVGRHHDPFTTMRLFEQPQPSSIYWQPVTDGLGARLARVTGGVAAYNGLVLLSFPLAAVAAFLLARRLGLSSGAAGFAAAAFAFSPFHLAHAAYHPEVAQVQWIPLYFLALWAMIDRPSPAAVGGLLLASMLVAFSNFYGGLIAAIITPFAVAGFWLSIRPSRADANRHVGLACAVLLLFALAAAAWIWRRAPVVFANPSAFAFAPSDPYTYSARWWSYLVPPLAHPWLGAKVATLWASAGVRDGLLEQQVAVGWGVIALGLAALMIRHRRRTGLILAALAAIALVWSLSPSRAVGGVTFTRPSMLLAHFAPMFRSYARFGVIVQLMAALLAALGLEALWKTRRTSMRLLASALVLLTTAEYAVAPSAMSRDVLPTAAHRWLVSQPDVVRALDCVPSTAESRSVTWLSGGRIAPLGGDVTDCLEPGLADKLAAEGFTHLLVPRASAAGRYLSAHGDPPGLRRSGPWSDALLFVVANAAPDAQASTPVHVATLDGFSPREIGADWTWRWMGGAASMTIVNGRAGIAVVALAVEIEAFAFPRHLRIQLDGAHVGRVAVGTARQTIVTPLMRVPRGRHVLTLEPVEPPVVADTLVHSGDRRPLSFAIGAWRWITQASRRTPGLEIIPRTCRLTEL